MKKQKIYAMICLASLLMFFQSSVLFIADTFINYHIDEVNACMDLGEQENSNRTANPLEEETLHPSIEIVHTYNTSSQIEKEYSLYFFKIKTNYQENTTPPPEHV